MTSTPARGASIWRPFTVGAIAAISLAFGHAAKAQEDEASVLFDQLVRDNIYPATMSGGTLSGIGYNWLVQEGAKANYFVVGEVHGVTEFAEATSSLFKGLNQRGYDYVAMELGPLGAKKAGAIAHAGGYDALSAYLSSYIGGDSIAFLDFKPEAKMVAEMVATSEAGAGTLWGFDQEVFMSLGMNFETMAGLVRSDAAKEAIAAMQARFAEDKELMRILTDEELSSLRDIIAADGSADALYIVDEIILSREIYKPYFGDGFRAQSQTMREENMMDNFMRQVRGAEAKDGKAPKVLLKADGYTHLFVGTDPRFGRVFFGTFVEMFARTRQEEAFNVYFDCKQGSAEPAQGTPYSACMDMVGWDRQQEKSSDVFVFGKHLTDPDSAYVIDLRPIRARLDKMPQLDENFRRWVTAWDAYLVLPATTRAEQF